MFSGHPETVAFGAKQYRAGTKDVSLVLNQLFDNYQLEGLVMSYTMENFLQDFVREHLVELPAEEGLKGLLAEEGLKGLPLEEILRQYFTADLEAFLKTQKTAKT